MNKRSFYLLLLVFFVVGIVRLTAATVLELRYGESLRGDVVLQEGKLQLSDGRSIPTAEVKQIRFNVGEQADSVVAVEAVDLEAIRQIEHQAASFIERHSDASAVILADIMNYTYRADGTHVLRSRTLAKVMKEDRLSMATQGTHFTEGRERVNVLKARSINPDGTVFSLDPKDVRVTKAQSSPGMFMKYQLLSFRIPGVQVGSLVEYELEVDTYNPYNREFFFPINYFQGHDPVFLSHLEITIPKDKTLYWEERNFPAGAVAAKETSSGDTKTYVWETREMPPMVDEPSMPPGADAMPYVQASLFEGWDKIFDWINQYWKPNTTPSADLASKAIELTRDLKTEDEKVAKIFHWIQKNIRYIIIKGDAATVYGSYPAHETVSKQFGCCVDKAMVMSAMLNAIGVKNGPLLINAGSHNLSKRIPNLNITHSISRITRPDGSFYYLDSTGYDHRYPGFPSFNQGRYCLDPFNRSVDEIPMRAPEENLHHLVSTLSLDLNGLLQAQTLKEYTGDFEAWARGSWKSIKEEERGLFLSRRINKYGKGAELATYSLNNLQDIEFPFSYSFSYRIPQYPREAADLMVFAIPGLLDYLTFPEAGLATRVYPIEYDSTEMQKEEGTITLADGLQIRSLPEPVQVDTPWFAFRGEYQRQGDRTISYVFEFRRLAKRVELKDYAEFKRQIDRVQKCSRERIFLVKTAQGGKQ